MKKLNLILALFMATTYLGTHGYKEGLPYSYQKIYDESKVFFN